MVDASTFALKPDFPIAGVADLYAKKPYLESMLNQAQQGQLVGGIQTLGAGLQSLAQRKMMMAQALAAAKMYMATPEGQAMSTPTITSGTQQMPVAMNQTAQGTDAKGNILPQPVPNVGPQGAIATRPQTTTTTTPPAVGLSTMANAFYGTPYADVMKNLMEQTKQKQQFGLEQQKQAFTEKMKPLELAQQAQLTNALTGVRGREVSVQEQNNIRNQISNLEAKKAQAIKDFPELSGTFIKGILPAGSNAKEEAAFRDYQETQKQIENYNRQLYGGSSKSDSPAAHMSSADLLAIINQTRPQ